MRMSVYFKPRMAADQILRVVFMCFGGSAPSSPPVVSPPPPAQLAVSPQAALSSARAGVNAAAGANGGPAGGSTLLTGGLGDVSPLAERLGRKSLLGQ